MHTAEPCDWIHHTKECHGAQRGGDEHRYDRALRTERTTDERHERYVAESHSLALERHFAEPTEGHDRFYDRIHRRNGLRATSAAGAQNEPARDRNVLEPRELMAALRTARARANDRQLAGPSRYADIQE